MFDCTLIAGLSEVSYAHVVLSSDVVVFAYCKKENFRLDSMMSDIFPDVANLACTGPCVL